MINRKINMSFAYILLVVIIFCSCETKNITVKTTNNKINGQVIDIYVIDSCEYIGSIYNINSDILTHKGNCKFCTKRNKK